MQFKDHITPQTEDTVKLPYPLFLRKTTKNPLFLTGFCTSLHCKKPCKNLVLVEAAGVEPASGNLPLHFLRTYLLFWISLLRAPGSRIPPLLSCLFFAPLAPGLQEQLSCLHDAPIPIRQAGSGER